MLPDRPHKSRALLTAFGSSRRQTRPRAVGNAGLTNYNKPQILENGKMESMIENLEIIKYPDPRLRASCAGVVEFDAGLADLARRMLELMKQSNGVGLAGPQVGNRLRLFVCNHTGEPEDDLVIINPELSELEGCAEASEGCLSIPDVLVDIRRAERCRLKAQDAEGNTFELWGEGLRARVWQHEYDHLRGRLILDYMNEASRIANRRIIKQLESSFNP